LVENGSVGTKEGYWVKVGRVNRVLQTDAVLLTPGLWVSIVTSKNKSITREGCLLDTSKDGIVCIWFSWNGVFQPLYRVISLILYS